jgi:hypothetical protein
MLFRASDDRFASLPGVTQTTERADIAQDAVRSALVDSRLAEAPDDLTSAGRAGLSTALHRAVDAGPGDDTPSLTHGDLWRQNVILRDARIAWESRVRLGHAVHALSMSVYFLRWTPKWAPQYVHELEGWLVTA